MHLSTQNTPRACCDHDRMAVGFTTIYATTKVVSLNLTSCEVYSYNITMYVIKFVSDLWQVGGFLQELRFTPPPTSRYS